MLGANCIYPLFSRTLLVVLTVFCNFQDPYKGSPKLVCELMQPDVWIWNCTPIYSWFPLDQASTIMCTHCLSSLLIDKLVWSWRTPVISLSRVLIGFLQGLRFREEENVAFEKYIFKSVITLCFGELWLAWSKNVLKSPICPS